MTHLESLRSSQCCLEGLELNSSYLDLLLLLILLLNELLDCFLYNRLFQALFYYSNHLIQLWALSINLFKKITRSIGIGCSFYVTSITFPCKAVICFCTMCYSWYIFILSTMVSKFICTCMENVCCCTSCSCASSFLSSISLMRHSYVCVLLSLSCLHSEVRVLILITIFLVVSSI
jgi:hypothetical protein